jgi:hypothetical protein
MILHTLGSSVARCFSEAVCSSQSSDVSAGPGSTPWGRGIGSLSAVTGSCTRDSSDVTAACRVAGTTWSQKRLRMFVEEF